MLNILGLIGKRYNKLQSDEIINLFKSNDILMFTETWLNDSIDCEVNNFRHYFLNRTNRAQGARRDSGGIIIYVSERIAIFCTFEKFSSDNVIWLKFDSGLFSLDSDLFLCLCYNAPSNSARVGLDEVNVYNLIMQDMIYIENKYNNNCNFVLAGDWNSRIGNALDFVQNDQDTLLDLNLLPGDYITDDYLQRVSNDNVVNENGRLLLDFCRQSGVRVMNGRIGDDRGVGRYTCVQSNGSSVVDLVLCKQDMMSFFNYFTVDEPNILSDHCLIRFNIGKLPMHSEDSNFQIDRNSNMCSKYKWKDDRKDLYIQSCRDNNIVEQLSFLSNDLNGDISSGDINDNLNSFCNCLSDVVKPLFKVDIRNIQNGDNYFDKLVNKSCYDDSCKGKQRAF